jgi:hypothetical protein
MREFQIILKTAERFAFLPERQYHTLKHFSSVDTAYAEQLQQMCGGVPDDPEERLEKQVSKFMSVFARNPHQVLDRLADSSAYFITRLKILPEKTEVQVKFNKDEFPEGIGHNRVVHFSRVNRENVFAKQGLFFSRAEIFQPTWLLNLVLRPHEETYEIITFFPGIYAPPLPDKDKQSSDEYKRSRAFWNQHVIVGSLK